MEDTALPVEAPAKPEVVLVPTSQFPELSYKFPVFNPFQSAFVPHHNLDENVVVSARTGAGKTVIAEMCINHSVSVQGKRAIFLAPMRSLVKEKFDDWSDENHSFSEFGVSMVSGDYRLTDARQKELDKNKIVLMTSEMLDSRTRRMHLEKNEWLLKTDVIVVDEAHIIGMLDEQEQPLEGRGHKLECALMRFTKLNPKCRIVLLSATLPNLPDIGRWITKLNGKHTEVIVSDYIPQPVDWHLEQYPEVTGWGTYHINKASMIRRAVEVLKQHPDDMWLIFTHSKKEGKQMQGVLSEQLGEQVEFHSADLDKEARIVLEKRFKGREATKLIATSTLAYGVNMPARRVMILDKNRGLSPVHTYDIKQMGGRAGRPGIDDRGDVHWIVGDKSARAAQFQIDNMPEAKSLMFDVDVFAFHIVAEVAGGSIRNREDVIEFYNRCLACHQGAVVTKEWLDKLVDSLVRHLAIKIGDDGEFKITALGRIASNIYFSPFDIHGWWSNWKTLTDKKIKNDAALIWAWGAIRSNSMTYLPKDCIDALDDFRKELNQPEWNMKGCEAAIVGLWKHIKGKPEDIPPSSIGPTRGLIADSERHEQAMKMIDQMYGHFEKAEGIKLLSIRIKYGCGWNQARLCTLSGIGKVRAEKLIKAGIKTVDQFVKETKKCIEILGAKIYNNAIPEDDNLELEYMDFEKDTNG